jgi:hypothetical protein
VGIFGQCSADQATLHTNWAPNTDLLLRKTIKLPALDPNSNGVIVNVKIRGGYVAYWNGQEIGQGQNLSACPVSRRLVVPPSSLLRWGDTNLLAIRARDPGALRFVDAQVVSEFFVE